MKPVSLCTAAAFALGSTLVLAQSGQNPQPSPEQMRQTMQTTTGAMVSVMGPMTDAVLEAQLSAAAKPETAERIAAFKKNLYDALLKKGFNGVDAMQIVIATPAPSASPGSR